MSLIEIDVIRDPLWTKPVFVQQGEGFSITLDLDETNVESLCIKLVGDFHCEVLTISDTSLHYYKNLHQVHCIVSNGCSAGLYDLEVEWAEGRATMPHSVKVLGQMPDNFQFVHMSDPHIGNTKSDESIQDLQTIIDQINVINPDFALMSGDIINRYGTQKEILPPEVVHNDMIKAQQILLDLKVPLFITAGNHDLAFPWIRRDYRKYFTRPIEGHLANYTFTYGNVLFVTFEAFYYFDLCIRHHRVRSLTNNQMRWLDKVFEGSESYDTRIMFFHYDYSLNQLLPIYNKHSVELALCGHTKPNDEIVGTTPTRRITEKCIYHNSHFRLVTIKDNKIDKITAFNRAVVPEAKAIDVKLLNANDGEATENEMHITNHSTESFKNLVYRFKLQSGQYEVVNAEKIEQNDDEKQSIIDISFDVSPRQLKVIEVKPEK